MNIFSLSVRNIGRRPIRSLAILFGLTSVSAVLFSLTITYLAVSEGIKKSKDRLGADAMAVPAAFKAETGGILLAGAPSEFYMNTEIARRIKVFSGIRAAASQLFIVSAPLACCTVSDTMLIGFEPDNDFTITPWLRQRLGRTLRDDEVLIGSDILSEPGGKIRFYGSEFKIAGKLEPTGMRFIDSSVFLPMAGARRMIAESTRKAEKALNIPPDVVSAVLLRFDETARPEEIALKIEYAMPEIKIVLSDEVLKTAKRNLGVPLKAVALMVALQWTVSMLFIAVLFGLSIGERLREIGVLRAMGAKKRDIRMIILYEAFVLSALAGSAGFATGLGFILMFSGLLKALLGVPFLLPSAKMMAAIGLTTVTFTVLTGLIAVIYPSLKAADKSILDAIST